MKKRILYTAYVVALVALLFFDKVISFVMSVINVVTAPINCSGILLCTIGAILIILVECLRRNYPILKQKTARPSPTTTPLYSDQPTSDDKYERDIPAKLLVEKILSTFNNSQADKGSFVININETYGFGKTSFLNIFEKQLQKSSQPYLYIDYRPWLCENEQAIVKEFFTLLGKKLKDYNLNDDISQYMTQLIESTSQVVPWWAKAPLSFIAKNIKLRPLQEIHDTIRDALRTIDKPIIVTIDDVDRLQEKELTAVLKLIRDTADFPNIFYIVAAENEHLYQMLFCMGVQHPEIYLKKFFNLDFLLPAHESIPVRTLSEELKNILQAYHYSSHQVTHMSLMTSQLPHLDKIFCNMREVYRFLNTYTSSLDLLKNHNNLSSINPYELFCLTIIKHLRIDVYKILRDRNDEFLVVMSNNLDSILCLKDEINLEKILRNKNMKRLINKNSNEVVTKEERKREQEEAENRSLDDVIQLMQITHDKLVFFLLDHLFERSGNKDERSICRCNVYFLYFSGKYESNKQSTAETIDILKMEQNTYEKKIDALFKEGKGNAFSNNFSYAYSKSGITKEEAMKKYYTFLKIQFINNPNRNSRISTPFEEFINRYPDSYMTFLGELYGRSIIDREQIGKNQIQEALKSYCQTESDLNMLALAFSIFSSHISGFCFGREFIAPMIELISNRLIEEHMKTHIVKEIPYATFATIKLLKEEFSTNDKWQKKFEAFLSEDELRCKQWLGSMVDIYDNGNIDWNYHRHEAILGESSNSGEELLNLLKQKFPDCAEAIEELSHLQHYSSLSDINLKDNKFIQMAGDNPFSSSNSQHRLS